MKKVLLFVFFIGICYITKAQTNANFFGTWKVESVSMMGKQFDRKNMQELYKLMFEESKVEAMKEDSVFSSEDSLAADTEANLLLDRIFEVTYIFSSPNRIVVEQGEKTLVKYTGTYNYNKAANKLTIKTTKSGNTKTQVYTPSFNKIGLKLIMKSKDYFQFVKVQ